MMFEAFADNFAREAYFALAGTKPSLDSLTEATLLMCEDILIRRSKPYLDRRDFDDHPSGQNRLKMFFSHPLIEKLSGCKSNYKTEKGYVLRCQ
ncbi:MAG: hypothetical protein J0M15_02160 [Deltaproteobacteria bacterium]|nr:hypothetical protein [Deltaproteobacteria bacterium]